MGWIRDCNGRIGRVGVGWFRFKRGRIMFVLVDTVYSRVKLCFALA